ncbi:MAG TPA: hypothetical protein VGS19_15730 [Streptosporangiaceae bacterium]|nr:hypothetical protein [Streptosporangiaceae bacterium]
MSRKTAAVLAAAVVVVGAGGYAAAGQVGAVVVAVLAAAVALLAVWLRIPSPPSKPVGGTQLIRAADEFTSFGDIQNALHLATLSRWHFDQVTGPRIRRLLAALLAHRRRVDISHDTSAAREALGPDLWALLDPAREASIGSREPAVSQDTIRRIVGRLEGL